MELAAYILVVMPLCAFIGYPVVLLLAARALPRRPGRAVPGNPSLTILICAHNEAARIGEKIASVLAALDATGLGAQIIIGDDASNDGTASIVEGFAHRGVVLVRAPRGGKAATLNRIVPLATGEIIVMTDADPLFDADTLPALLAPFADPAVGCVAGSVETIRGKDRKAHRFAAADSLFRRYESAMRAAEDSLFGCVSADGGIYAIRAALMPHVPGDVTDDFYISTAAVAARQRIAFAPAARVYEHSIAGDKPQFRRRVRITVRGLTGLWRRRALMNPLRTGWYAVALVFHKVARRLAPLALPPLWVLSGVLALGGHMLPWGVVFAGLTAAVALGVIGFLQPVRLPKPLAVAYGAVLHLAGLSLGAILFLSGRRYSQWTPQKSSEPSA